MSLEARNQLIESHLPIAGYITSEFLSSNTGLDRDEIASVAFEALVMAADNHDPDKMAFGAYARVFLRNRIRDHLREADTVGRRVREQVEQSRQIERDMEARLGRSVTIVEIADAMGSSSASLQVKRSQSLGDVPLPPGVEDTLSDAGWDPEGSALIMERARFIASAVSELPDALRRVVDGIFLRNMSVNELAADMGVSHAAVSQRKAEALELLRGAYRRDYDKAAPLPVVAKKRVSASRSDRYFNAVHARLQAVPVLA